MSQSRSAPTVADVARLAGVSKATVSYVLSGRRSGASRISAETRLRVLDAVRSLGYVPNSAARALRRQLTERICLVVPRLGVPYLDLLAQQLQAAALTHGYSIVIAVDDPRQPQVVIEQLRRRLADGAVFVADTAPAQSDATALARANVAVVVASNDLRPDGFDVVRDNSGEACRSAVEYLAGKGHRRIAFVGHFMAEDQQHPRHREYLDAMATLRLAVDERLVVAGAASRTEAYHNAKALLALPERPTAIFAASDVAAVSALWAARDSGLRVPEDVAVIGVGNIPEDGITHPPLCSVGPTTPASAAIIDLLFSRLGSDPPPPGRVASDRWALFVRGSA